MGWSEQYWEDVKSELENSATEPDPTDGADDFELGGADRLAPDELVAAPEKG